MFLPNCLPILIGSLPLHNHGEALQLILSSTPEIPLWPQLPKNPREGMVRQFLSGFPGLTDRDKQYWIATDSPRFESAMTAFYEDYMQAEGDPAFLQNSRFGMTPDTAPGFFTFCDYFQKETLSSLTVKGQITGPITTGIGIKDHNGRSIFYDNNLRDMLVKLLSLKAKWQLAELKKYTDKIPPIIFIDEPGLVSFGSSGFNGVSEQLVSETVAEVINTIKAEGGLPGVHICANGDWGPALSSSTNIISFDAYFYFDNFILYREQLISFLSRGGILAWGIVPTGDPLVVEKESVDTLFFKWKTQLKTLSTLGFSEKQLMQQTLIAPSCGTGSLPVELAQKVLSMTRDLSQLVRKYLGTI
jgi:hypothetical protein